MGRILRHWRILGASFVSLMLIVGAYVAATGIARPPTAQASEESKLLQQIATRDADGDGLPDWEEALYGTDPHNPDTKHLGMTDGEAVAKGLIVPVAIANIPQTAVTTKQSSPIDPSLPVPAEGTLTAAFAKNFFSLYISALKQTPDGNLSESDLQKIATESLTELSQSITAAPNFKSAANIKVSGSGLDAMRRYAAAAEAVYKNNKANAAASEIVYLKQALEGTDPSALTRIASIANAYRQTAVGLSALSVPQELAADHLALINTMARIGEIVQDFTLEDSDPLATMLALQQYPQAVQNLTHAFIQLANDYKSAGITIASGEPGASLVNLISDVSASQKKGKQP